MIHLFCSKIAVLKKLSDTITNELRTNITNRKYTKYRGDKFKVICVINKFNINEQINTMVNSVYSNQVKAIYKVNKDVKK